MKIRRHWKLTVAAVLVAGWLLGGLLWLGLQRVFASGPEWLHPFVHLGTIPMGLGFLAAGIVLFTLHRRIGDQIGKPRTVQEIDPVTGEPQVRRGSVTILVWAWIATAIGGLLMLQGLAMGALGGAQLMDW